jgi:chorismate mutase
MGSMFELSKKILTKVSFDKALFRKELAKAFNYLKREEKVLLKVWAMATFGNAYKDVIIEVYRTVMRS